MITFNAALGVAVCWAALYQLLDVTASTGVLGAIIALAGSALALGIVFVRFAAPDAMRMIRWSSQPDRGKAEETWIATTRLVHRDVAAGIAFFSLVFIPITALLVDIADLPWTSFVPFYAGIEIAILFSATLDYFAVETLLRPLRRDVATHLPADFQPEHRPIPLRIRLLAVIVVASLSTSLLATAVAGAADSPEERLSSGVGVALLVAVTIGLLPASVLARSESLSRSALMRAARKVESGDLKATIPLADADETAVVAASFNRMVLGLQEREALRGRNAELVDELRASRARIVATADESRRRVERDLHDGAQQSLVLLKLKLGLVERKLAEDSEGRDLLAEVHSDLDRALRELRDLAHGIYPQVLTSDGIAAALTAAAKQVAIPAEVSNDGAGRYPPELEGAVYFCCVEALQNAAKYAGDGVRAHVSVTEKNGRLQFEVADDGAGFDLAAVEGGAGLQNIADRVGALGGEVAIESRPGSGTKVVGSVPLRTCARAPQNGYAHASAWTSTGSPAGSNT